MDLFFEMHRDWPEGCASLTIKKGEGLQVSHLDVYKKPCGEAYLQNFRITHFSLGYLPDLLPNNLGWYLASPRLCNVLKTVRSEITASIQSISRMQFPDCHEAVINYSLVSATQVVDCLDKSNVALTWFDEGRDSLEKYTHLVLLRNRIPAGASFFAVTKVVSTFVVSEKIQKVIKDSNFSGVAFRECELVEN